MTDWLSAASRIFMATMIALHTGAPIVYGVDTRRDGDKFYLYLQLP